MNRVEQIVANGEIVAFAMISNVICCRCIHKSLKVGKGQSQIELSQHEINTLSKNKTK